MPNLPLPKCEYCERALMHEEQFICQYCKGIFCSEHRLPPKHSCPLIALWNSKHPPKKRTTSRHHQLKKFLDKRRKKPVIRLVDL